MTTDADLVVNTSWVKKEPELYSSMVAGGFVADTQPGMWLGKGGVRVDLMVAPYQSGRTGKSVRAADFPPHRKGVARVARGLEAALVDNDITQLTALAETDARKFDIRVAGPSALLVAKLIKLHERIQADDRSRVREKDALDVFRLLRLEVPDLLAGFARHRAADHAVEVSAEAVSVLHTHGIKRTSVLPRLAGAAVGGDQVIEASFVALAIELLSALEA